MRLFQTIDISGSGLTAERVRMDLIANNIANAHTTRTADGGPYRRQVAVFSERPPKGRFQVPGTPLVDRIGNGVRVANIQEDMTTNFQRVYDPSHPDSDEFGYVLFPNIEPIKEMVDLITATRAYEANTTVITNTSRMMNRALEIGGSR